MSKSALTYDKSSKESILEYARQLLGKSLKNLHEHSELPQTGKGGLGTAVEKYHFGYEPNSKSEPDFKEAGVELKCTPLKRISDGSMLSKERLVLNVIDYIEEASKTFATSSFWTKNSLLLLMFYLHEEKKIPVELVFKIVRLWNFPETDLKIIRDDWTIIHNKIIAGKAHELSEGDTLYLAACTKGSKAGAEMRQQPNSSTQAPQRAYSIKSKYVNTIILDSLVHPEMCSDLFVSDAKKKKILKAQEDAESVVRSVSDYNKDETFEQLIERKFSKFYGKTIAEIEEILGVVFGQSKSMAYNVCRAILGVKAKKIAEFEKAEITPKTIRLEANGKLKEAMSFPNVNYKEIVKESYWEESALYRMFTQRFLFIVFRKPVVKDDKQVRLEKVMFWTMPYKDLEQGEVLWANTREKVKADDYDHFIKSSENPVCHIRPKAQNAADTTESAQGRQVKKMCYWLNREYVLRQISLVK
jgi:DNA mismatch repair protein MutH